MERRTDLVRTHTLGALALALLLPPAAASAQTATDSFERATAALAEGQRVIVTDVGGGNTKGRVVEVTPTSITINVAGFVVEERRSFDARTVRMIRRTDSLWNGLLIGAGAGIVATEVWTRQTCGKDPECAAIVRLAGWGALAGGGAAVGALIDKFTGNQVLFRSAGSGATLHITPLIGPRATGLSLSLRY